MEELFEELIQTIERHTVNNSITITNVSLWAKSWRREMQDLKQALEMEKQQVAESNDIICKHCQHYSKKSEDEDGDGYGYCKIKKYFVEADDCCKQFMSIS